MVLRVTFFVKDISHVLKVRIIADMKYRIACMMEREDVSKEKAERIVKEVDEERKKWSMKLYGIHTWDSRLYDLVINIKKISVDYAVQMICDTLKLSAFQTTPDSQKRMEDLAKEAEEKLRSGPGMAPFFEPRRDFPWQNTE